MADESPGVSFAIISSAPAASALLEAVCEDLVARTGMAIHPVVYRAYDKLVDGMRRGEVDVAWAPPLLAIDLEREQHARIRLCSRRAGRADYSCALFAAAGSSVATLADVAGKRVAWVAKESSAGYVFPRLKLIAAGIDPDAAFAEQSFRRTHEAVVRCVLAGEADVGATYASFPEGQAVPTSSGWLEAGVQNDAVRVLATAGPIPSDVIALSTRLPPDRADRIAAALRELGRPILQLLGAESFAEPAETHFDELRRLVEQAKPAARA